MCWYKTRVALRNAMCVALRLTRRHWCPCWERPSAITCPALDNFEGNVFGSAPAGTADVEGTCVPGYEMLDAQRPIMTCGLDGEWTGVVNNSCIRTWRELLCDGLVVQNVLNR